MDDEPGHEPEPRESVARVNFTIGMGATAEAVEVARSVRDALAGESVDELLELGRDLRRSVAIIASRLEEDKTLQSWRKREPEIFHALVQAVITLFLYAVTQALTQTRTTEDPAPITVVVEPPSDEDIARVVEDVLRQREDPRSGGTTQPPAARPD